MRADFVDTNVLVRYLTGEPSELAERAVEILDDPEPLTLSELVLVETAYVLESVYGVARARIVDALIELVQRRNLRPLHLSKAQICEALELCRPSGRVSFTDALIWAQAREAGAERIYSFDRRFPDHGVEISG